MLEYPALWYALNMSRRVVKSFGSTTLMNSDGTKLSVTGITTAPVILVQTPHNFIVMEDNFSTSVIQCSM